jgi:hypothetical protein
MALTKDFKETIKDRIERDPAFREELLKEGIECLLTGDVDTGKAILRDFINATMGFESLGSATDSVPKAILKPAIFLKLLRIFKSRRAFISKCRRSAKKGIESRLMRVGLIHLNNV